MTGTRILLQEDFKKERDASLEAEDWFIVLLSIQKLAFHEKLNRLDEKGFTWEEFDLILVYYQPHCPI